MNKDQNQEKHIAEWVVKEDEYQEKIHIPVNITRSNNVGDQEWCSITNLSNGSFFMGPFKVMSKKGTDFKELYLTKYVQALIVGSGEFRIRLFC